MTRTFRFEGQDWEAVETGSGTGFAMGRIPRATSYKVRFKALDGSESERVGAIHRPDPNDVSLGTLRQALRDALTAKNS